LPARPAVSLSIGVSLAHNEIRSEIEASIRNAPNVEARTGDIVINAGALENPAAFPSDYSASGTVALKKGDTVASGGQAYRFLARAKKFTLPTNRPPARST